MNKNIFTVKIRPDRPKHHDNQMMTRFQIMKDLYPHNTKMKWAHNKIIAVRNGKPRNTYAKSSGKKGHGNLHATLHYMKSAAKYYHHKLKKIKKPAKHSVNQKSLYVIPKNEYENYIYYKYDHESSQYYERVHTLMKMSQKKLATKLLKSQEECRKLTYTYRYLLKRIVLKTYLSKHEKINGPEIHNIADKLYEHKVYPKLKQSYKIFNKVFNIHLSHSKMINNQNMIALILQQSIKNNRKNRSK